MSLPPPAIASDHLCVFTDHGNGIHECKLLVANKESWDAYWNWQIALQDNGDQTTTLHVLLDSTVGTLPITHAFQSTRLTMKSHPLSGSVRTAVLYDDSLLLSLIENWVKGLRANNATVRFFHSAHRDEAVHWLLEE